jgi:hypothetical protein
MDESDVLSSLCFHIKNSKKQDALTNVSVDARISGFPEAASLSRFDPVK